LCQKGLPKPVCNTLLLFALFPVCRARRKHNLLAQAQFGKLQSEGGFLDAAFEAALQGATVYAKDGKSLALRAG